MAKMTKFILCVFLASVYGFPVNAFIGDAKVDACENLIKNAELAPSTYKEIKTVKNTEKLTKGRNYKEINENLSSNIFIQYDAVNKYNAPIRRWERCLVGNSGAIVLIGDERLNKRCQVYELLGGRQGICEAERVEKSNRRKLYNLHLGNQVKFHNCVTKRLCNRANIRDKAWCLKEYEYDALSGINAGTLRHPTFGNISEEKRACEKLYPVGSN